MAASANAATIVKPHIRILQSLSCHKTNDPRSLAHSSPAIPLPVSLEGPPQASPHISQGKCGKRHKPLETSDL